MGKELVGTIRAAQRLGITRGHLTNHLVRDGILPFEWIDGRRMFDVRDIDRLKAEGWAGRRMRQKD